MFGAHLSSHLRGQGTASGSPRAQSSRLLPRTIPETSASAPGNSVWSWALKLCPRFAQERPGPRLGGNPAHLQLPSGHPQFPNRRARPGLGKGQASGLGPSNWPHLLPPQAGQSRAWAAWPDSVGSRSCVLGPGIKPPIQGTHRPALCNTHALLPQRGLQRPSPNPVHSSPQCMVVVGTPPPPPPAVSRGPAHARPGGREVWGGCLCPCAGPWWPTEPRPGHCPSPGVVRGPGGSRADGGRQEAMDEAPAG